MSGLVSQIDSCPEIWNQYTERTEAPTSPHRDVDDVWYRFCPRDNIASAGSEHSSEWYPSADLTPAIKGMVDQIYKHVKGTRLGGVLMTRIPPGRCVLAHHDDGWHAKYYDKICVSLKANEHQAFCFDGISHVTEPGDIFWFENSVPHWVHNCSNEERISLIICLKHNSGYTPHTGA